MSKFYFNVFENLKSPEVSGQRTLNELFDLMKAGGKIIPIVNCIRELGKEDELYKGLKMKLPAVAWNVSYNVKRSKENIKGVSGYMYFDKDSLEPATIPHLKDSLMKLPYVVASWISVGARGLGCLIKTCSVDMDIYDAAWIEIDKAVGIGFDKGAKNLTQANIISYDPDIRINEQAECYQFASSIKGTSFITQVSSSSVGNSNAWTAPSISSSLEKVPFSSNIPQPYVYDQMTPSDRSRLLLNTQFDESFFGEDDYKLFPNGYEIVKTYCPYEIKEGKRNSTLLAITTNLICLNHEANADNIVNFVYKINVGKCKPPYSYREIKYLVDRCFQQKKQGKLYPSTQKRSIIFKATSSLSPRQKQSISAKECGRLRSAKTQHDVLFMTELFEENGVKVTQKQVAEALGKSISTVKRYWKAYKDKFKP